jgi:hypothetical protein
VSYTAIGCVEILYPNFVRGGAIIYLDAVPDVYALLAFPWGTHSKDDDLPAPIVKPRGLPDDASLIVLHQISLYVDEKAAKDPSNERAITAKAARGLLPLKSGGDIVYLDPDVKCPTWLTPAEVRKARDIYMKRQKHPSGDLNAVASMMMQYERQELVGGKHPKTRLVVWFT